MADSITLSTREVADLASRSTREERLAHYQLPSDPISLELANLRAGSGGTALNLSELPRNDKGGRTIG